MEPINVLCYGDSNTYGYNPENGLRYSSQERWTGRLKTLLGEGYNVIEEGCNGRTTVFDDPIEGWKNGFDYLKPCLNSHKPVHWFVMMLGSNDLKNIFGTDAKGSAQGAETLIKEVITFTEIKQGFVPKILLISPPLIGEGIAEGSFSRSFDANAHEKSLEFGRYFKDVARKYGCSFLDAALNIEASRIDSLHMTRQAHARLAELIARVLIS